MSKHTLNIRQEVILDNGHKFCARTYQEERDMAVPVSDIVAAWDKIQTVDEELTPSHFDLCGDSLTLCVEPKVYRFELITKEDFNRFYCAVDETSLAVKYYDRDCISFGSRFGPVSLNDFVENKNTPLTFEAWCEYKKYGRIAQWLQPSLRKEFDAALEYRKEKIKIVTEAAEKLWLEVDAQQQKRSAELADEFEKYCDWLGWEMYSEKDKP
jgi:hypothetical protein